MVGLLGCWENRDSCSNNRGNNKGMVVIQFPFPLQEQEQQQQQHVLQPVECCFSTPATGSLEALQSVTNTIYHVSRREFR